MLGVRRILLRTRLSKGIEPECFDHSTVIISWQSGVTINRHETLAAMTSDFDLMRIASSRTSRYE